VNEEQAQILVDMVSHHLATISATLTAINKNLESLTLAALIKLEQLRPSPKKAGARSAPRRPRQAATGSNAATS